MQVKKSGTLLIIMFVIATGCQQKYDRPAGQEGWLKGDTDEKFETVAGHLGGFGKAMWEVDYRFQELYFAGKGMNWGYAAHQLEELEEVLVLGLERRPERAASAEQFLTSAIPGVAEALDARDTEMFERRITLMMNTCNSCHVLEEMPFLTVTTPVNQRSSIR